MPLGNAGIGPGIGNSDPARQLQLMVRSGLSFSGNESHVIFKNEKGKSFKSRFISSHIYHLSKRCTSKARATTDLLATTALSTWPKCNSRTNGSTNTVK